MLHVVNSLIENAVEALEGTEGHKGSASGRGGEGKYRDPFADTGMASLKALKSIFSVTDLPPRRIKGLWTHCRELRAGNVRQPHLRKAPEISLACKRGIHSVKQKSRKIALFMLC